MKALHLLPKYMLCTFSDAPVLKLLVSLATAVLNYLLPSSVTQSLATGALLLIILDTATGVAASRATGHKISSAKFGRALVKIFGYAVMVIVIGVAASTLPGGKSAHELLAGILLGYIVCTEAISITENVDKLGLPLPRTLKRWLRDRKKALETATADQTDTTP